MSHIEHTKNFPRLAIIGRPNVGKSSLFNRFLKARKAIVESVPGVTRDRLSSFVTINKQGLILIDTGGIVSKPKEPIEKLVYKQSSQAIYEADAVIFVTDITAGVSYQDEHIADIIRKTKEKAFLVVNKVDDTRTINDSFDFYKLGLGEPYPISVLHKRGLNKLFSDISDYIIEYNKTVKKESRGKDTEQANQIKIAVTGKPNVGKSSFINCLLDKERLLIDDVPGTTRDSIDITIKRDNDILVIIDTAGIRHKKKIKDVVEIFSLSRTKEAVRRSDTTLVMVEAISGLRRDDIAVLDYVIKQGKTCILLVNKWDLVKPADAEAFRKSLISRYRPIEWMPVIFTSCKDKHNIVKALDAACKISKKSHSLISTPQLNKFLKRLQDRTPHVTHKRTRPRIYYATQTGTAPPEFTMFCNNPKIIRKEYVRFIEASLRKEFDLRGVPIRFELRSRK